MSEAYHYGTASSVVQNPYLEVLKSLRHMFIKKVTATDFAISTFVGYGCRFWFLMVVHTFMSHLALVVFIDVRV
jgi:hypothetical protein